MIYLRKKVCLIIVHGNTANILDMSCYYKHQQQSYHNENVKMCMFIHYMYVDILFPLTKPIPIMFERVTHYHTLQTWMPYHTRYDTFSLSLAWFTAICNRLPRVTVKLLKKYVSIFYLKK